MAYQTSHLCFFSIRITDLGCEYSNSKLVRKVLRSLFKKFSIKVISIEEAKKIKTMRIDELLGSLQTFEMNLEEAKTRKLKFEKNISFSVAKTVPTEQSTVIKEMKEQLTLLTQRFNKITKNQFGKNKISESSKTI
uniref:Gag-pol polyprotein n=1 Tax=Gossypium raimondii TaxID=29730 RepID=A0A0D2MBQ1_GOSRA|nr:hypothetical protein B456_002G159800 [Gossypium raimondii]